WREGPSDPANSWSLRNRNDQRRLTRNLPIRQNELVALDLVVEGAFGRPEGAGSSGHVSLVPEKGLFEGPSLDLFEREDLAGGRRLGPDAAAAVAAAGRLDGSRHAPDQVLIRRQEAGFALDEVGQLAHVSGPLVSFELSHHFGSHIDRRALQAVRVCAQVVLDEQRNVSPALPQRRALHVHRSQPVAEVEPERAGRDRLLQLPRDGGDVDAYERRSDAGSTVVDRLGEHLLAGAALARDEDGDVRL